MAIVRSSRSAYATRASALNFTGIIRGPLLWTSVQAYGSSDIRPSPEKRMAATTLPAIKKFFRHLPEPRVAGRSRLLLIDIVVIAICAVIADCDDGPDIALFGQRREAWFRRFLKLPPWYSCA